MTTMPEAVNRLAEEMHCLREDLIDHKNEMVKSVNDINEQVRSLRDWMISEQAIQKARANTLNWTIRIMGFLVAGAAAVGAFLGHHS